MRQINHFSMPTKIISGVDCRNNLGKEIKSLGGTIIFVCTDKGISDAGLLVDILNSFNKKNLAYVIFDEVELNPTTDNVEHGLNVYCNEQCDILVSIGGGSAIDTAKAICSLINSNSDNYERATVVAVPTVAGTGSEVLGKAIVTDINNGGKELKKLSVPPPSVAVLDPVLLQTLPPHIAAVSGLETLTHAVEGYVSLGSSELTDLLNLKAIELVAKYLRPYVANRTNIEAAIGMQNACLYAAIGSSNAGYGNAYAMANYIHTNFNIHYGLACALILPNVMEFNTLACPDKFIKIAQLFGEHTNNLPNHKAALKAAEAVRNLTKDIGIPQELSIEGLTEEGIKYLSKYVFDSVSQRSNPRKNNLQDIIDLYLKSFAVNRTKKMHLLDK
ncbi:MAG: iron-containing alcohol dehydrogenase [Firmicutes bacterium]|nr:iron-containing alcohol dehydrogenase [Bacillota bacterium]